jgi:hypothetical protein
MSNARNIANLPNGDDAPVYACRAFASVSNSQTIEISKGLTSYTYSSNNHNFQFTAEAQPPDDNYVIVATFKNLTTNYAAFASITAKSSTGFSVRTYNTAANTPAYGVTVAVFY